MTENEMITHTAIFLHSLFVAQRKNTAFAHVALWKSQVHLQTYNPESDSNYDCCSNKQDSVTTRITVIDDQQKNITCTRQRTQAVTTACHGKDTCD